MDNQDDQGSSNHQDDNDNHYCYGYLRNLELTRAFFKAHPAVHREALFLYNKGNNDRYIAKKLNKKFRLSMNILKITLWRKLNGLSAKHTVGNVSCEIDERVGEKIIALNERGLTNGEIARKLHISPNKISTWKRTNGIVSKTRKVLSVEDEEKRFEVYSRGLSDKEIGEEVGVDRDAIWNWRKRRGLPPNLNQGGQLSNKDEIQRLDLYLKGLSDKQIAKEVNVQVAAINRWRKKRGLPNNKVKLKRSD